MKTPKKYRKKPAMVEAIRLQKNNIREVYKFLNGDYPNLSDGRSSDYWEDYKDYIIRKGMDIETPEGTLTASVGDYIVKGWSEKLGEHFWPVKPDYFKEAYEEVED